MPTSLLSLPTELVDIVCEEDPEIIPALRATCRNLESKTKRSFLKQYFEILPIKASRWGLETLQQISADEVFSAAIKELQIDLGGYDTEQSLHNGVQEMGDSFSGARLFVAHLREILPRLRQCHALRLSWSAESGPIICYSESIGIFLACLQAAVTSCNFIKDIRIDCRWDEGLSLVQLYHQFISRSCAAISSTSIEILDLTLHVDSTSKYEAPIPDECPQCVLSNVSTSYRLSQSGAALQHITSHVPNLKDLYLTIENGWTKWLPACFGTTLKFFVLQEVYYNQRWTTGTDGGKLLTKVLRRSPKLRSLLLIGFHCPTLSEAGSLLANLSTIDSLHDLELFQGSIGSRKQILCLGRNCHQDSLRDQHKLEWKTSNLREEVGELLQRAHAYKGYD